MRSIRVLRLSIFLCFMAALSCSHFETPEYSGPGDYSPAGEYMNSPEVRGNQTDHRPVIRGPFSLKWPVANPVINRGFISSGKRQHNGLDLKGRRNDNIYAAHDGFIVYAGQKFRGYGKMMIIEYDSGWATLYGHMNKFKAKTGEEVRAGQLIGFMGRTGRATGIHLHFEVLKDKEPIDPLPLLEQGNLVKTSESP
jgi:murein DD-endopeptidase MepM/ murein hydrolase activator NlpD